MQKENKGITLIALIITIIVMLILVGVTVTVSLNGGLFTTAKQGTDKTRAQQMKEQISLAISENMMAKYSNTEARSKSELIEQFVNEGKLTQAEAVILESQDLIEIGGIVVDFSELLDVEYITITFKTKIPMSTVIDFVEFKESEDIISWKTSEEYSFKVLKGESVVFPITTSRLLDDDEASEMFPMEISEYEKLREATGGPFYPEVSEMPCIRIRGIAGFTTFYDSNGNVIDENNFIATEDCTIYVYNNDD